jgi:hypothetical protein
MIRRAVLLLALTACASSPPQPKPIAMEALPPPAPPVKKKMTIHVNEAATIVGDAAVVQAEPGGVVRVYGDSGAFTLVGKQLGKTTLHFTDKDGDTQNVTIEVAAGEPVTRAVAIGETFVVPMKGVKEYSVGLPDLVGTSMTTDGHGLLVTGKKPGTTTILLIMQSGATESHELVVVGGKRHA